MPRKLINSQETLRIAKLKAETGRIPESDVLIAEVEFAQNQANISERSGNLEREKVLPDGLGGAEIVGSARPPERALSIALERMALRYGSLKRRTSLFCGCTLLSMVSGGKEQCMTKTGNLFSGKRVAKPYETA